ncbi:MAG TPA: glycosyltransferase family 39 protein [Aggregatilineales bacterium]|nr:glycosyltransferase family 39 protein [Aggregatilineales bacterium]
MIAKRPLIAMTTILLLAAGLRMYALAEKAVWWDEAWSIWTAQQPFVQTTEITADDVHPPLYEWLLHGWVRIAGISELAARYVSVLWGLLGVAAVYALAHRLGGTRAALLAALFITLSAFHVHWSQETRMYAMAACLGTLACYAYLRLGVCWSAWWALLIGACAAATLTHYLGILFIVILNLHWLLTLRRRPRAFHLRWIVAMLLCAAVLVVWVVYAIARTRGGGTNVEVPPAFIFQLAGTLLAVGTSVNVDQYVLPTVLVVAGLLAGLALYMRKQVSNGLLVLLVTLLPPVAIFLLSFPNHFYHPKPEERYLLIFVPVVYVGVGLALDQFLRLRLGIGRLAVLAMTILYGYTYLVYADSHYYRDDYASLLRTVSLLARPDEPVFFVSGDRYPLVYYHLNRAAGDKPPYFPYSPIQAQGIPLLGGDSDATLAQTIGSSQRFWVLEIERSLGDPSNKAIPWLDAHYHRVLRIPIDYNGIDLYAVSDMTLPDSTAILPLPIHEARPGDTARIGVPGGISAALSYQGQVIAKQDAAQTWQLAQFPIYPAFPPGPYQIQAGAQQYTIQVTHSLPPPVNPPTNVNAALGPFHILGYAVNTHDLHPGDTLKVTIYWRTDQRPTDNFTVFTHLIGSAFNPATNGPLWASMDSYPASTPTTALWPGLIIEDEHDLALPANTPSGDYQLEFGMYRLATGQRLSLANGSNRILVSGFRVGN